METLIPIILKYKYLIIFPMALAEGPILAITCGFLLSLGLLNFWLIYGILIAGDIIPDSIYYFIGKQSKKSQFISKYIDKLGINKKSGALGTMWQKYTVKMMFVTKLTYGLSAALLVTAGIIAIPFRKFISLSTLVSFVQYAVFLGLGFYLGQSYNTFFKYVKDAQIILTAVIILLAIIYYTGITRLGERFEKTIE